MDSSRPWIVTLIAALATWSLSGAEAACYGAQVPIRDGGYSFEYGAGYTPPPGCARSNVTVSRLYLQGACVNTRDNGFGNKAPDCSNSGNSVTDASSAVCQQVFAAAPKGALVDLSTVGNSDFFDYGSICTTARFGYLFLETDCAGANEQFFTFEMDRNGNGYCWDGHTVSRGAAAGAAIASFFVIFFIILGVLLCWRRRRNAQIPMSAVHMQPYPQSALPTYGGGGAPPASTYAQSPYGQQQPSSSYIPQPYQSYDDKPVTGIPVNNYPSRV